MTVVWKYMRENPYYWFLCCFTQPTRFKDVFSAQRFSPRRDLLRIFALCLLTCLLSYLLVFVYRLMFMRAANLGETLRITLLATSLGLALGLPGLALGISEGIVLALSGGLTLGLSGFTSLDTLGGLSIGITFALISGLLLGNTEDRRLRLVSFVAGGLALGLALGLKDALLAALALGATGAFLLLLHRSARSSLIGCIISGGIGFAILLLGETFLLKRVIGSILNDITIVSCGCVFLLAYAIGYYRILLYPFNCVSGLQMYYRSRQHPKLVFTYLHDSALYWNERLVLPLVGLKGTLLIAIQQNLEQTLREIDFIIHERPDQRFAVEAALIERSLTDMEQYDSLLDIAGVFEQLARVILPRTDVINEQVMQPFITLHDASRDASRACSPLGHQVRCEALDDMLARLQSFPLESIKDITTFQRLERICESWIMVATSEREELGRSPDQYGNLRNPYTAGNALKLNDNLFVGRRDLAKQLGEALGRRSQIPTFLLNGERRMGKSSTLRQLPNLLGGRYLPIFYDLQSPSISGSLFALLDSIARGIYEVLTNVGIRIKRLDSELLKAASQKSDAETYYTFDTWLAEIEAVLERENRVLLLSFDEFEYLNDQSRLQPQQLKSLLSWFRAIIQNHARVALLFSGAQTFSDLGGDWVSSFVNVQTLKVTFLKPDEAEQLITQPSASLAEQPIFPQDVVQEIKELAGCHPFLIQALCSALIEVLNTEQRLQASNQDLIAALEQVFARWRDYFGNLWQRTDPEQRAILTILCHNGSSTREVLEEHSSLQPGQVQRVLQKLQDRDLVRLAGQTYLITTVIFREWIERNQDQYPERIG